MTKQFVKARFEGIAWYVVCPFCKPREQAINETMPWCSTCGCEYKVHRRGQLGATFDQSLKTDKYAWGKALNLSGGVKIGRRK